jgi:ribonuclease-3
MDYSELEKRIGYTFRDKRLLLTACTHSSYAEHYKTESNENMEFFGDAILEMVVSETLYLDDERAAKNNGDETKTHDEGLLTKERANKVKDSALRSIVEKAGLDNYLRFFGKRQNNLGKKPIASLFEALTAAVYLDGGYGQAKAFVLSMLKDFSFEGDVFVNYKGALQEFLQKQGKSEPHYSFPEKTGKDHDPTYFVTASADGAAALGTGKSKKDAEQEAAKKLLEILKK